jgi:predicted outer membrane repeat protein
MRKIIFSLLGLGLAAPCFAIDYIVTRTDDPNPISPPLSINPCRPSGGCSLRQAILAANERAGVDRIVLRAETYTLSRTTSSTAIDGISGPLWVTDETEIIGDVDTRIQWNNTLHHAHSVLVYGDKTALAPRLQIQNLMIANGRGTFGGCVLSLGAELVMAGVTVENCRARDGGAIFSSGRNLKIYSSRLRYNEASNHGGAIYFARSATVIADWASFLANRALNDGGAIYAEGMFSSMVNFDTNIVWRSEYGPSEFLDNTAGRDGGAIALGVKSSLHLFRFSYAPRAHFERNIAVGRGGAVSVVSLSPSVLTKLTIEGALLKDNAAANGGAIAARGQSLISDSEFESNSAQSGAGGAIFLDNPFNAIYGSNEIRQSSFNSNSASANGGAIASVCQPLSLRDTSLWANLATTGLAIHSSGTTSLVHVSTRNHGASALVKGYSTACPNQNFSLANSIVGLLDKCASVSGALSSGGGNFYSANAPGCGFVAGLDFQYGSAVIAIEPNTYGGDKTVLGWHTDALVRPQVNAGVAAYCSTVDVRGLPRNGACDSGAFEQQ